MSNNDKLYYQAAEELYLNPIYIINYSCLKIFLGGKYYYFQSGITPLNNTSSVFLSKDKSKTNTMLKKFGCSVPKAVVVDRDRLTLNTLEELIRGLRFPLVAKPQRDTCRGTDVLCNIKELTVLANHVERLFKNHTHIQIEEFHQDLKEYRVLVLKNKVIGVVERFGAHVIGNGKHSIQELIDCCNKEREVLGARLTLSPLVVDEEYQQCLAEQHLSLASIPALGEKVRLCYTVNTGRGGTILSHGKKIHPRNRKYLCKAVRDLGLTLAGLDVLCEDINVSFDESKWLVLEVNHHPDITIHEVPNHGRSMPIAKTVVRQLIYRHPFAYLNLLSKNTKWSPYFRMGLCLFLFAMMYVFLV